MLGGRLGTRRVTVRLAAPMMSLCRAFSSSAPTVPMSSGLVGARLRWTDDYAEKVAEGDVFVAESASIAGLIVLIASRHHVLIENVAVDPDWQRTGVGSTVMAYAEIYVHELGLRDLRLYTNAATSENVTLYSRLGYSEVDCRTDDGFQRVLLSKTTTPPTL
jgi:GNAT superfamily N-acetyltransferase